MVWRKDKSEGANHMTTDMIGEIYGHKCVLSRASKGQCPVFL